MKVVKLSPSQKIGFRLLAEALGHAQANINMYVRTCLEDGGEDLAQPWRWNELKMQWELNDPSEIQSLRPPGAFLPTGKELNDDSGTESK